MKTLISEEWLEDIEVGNPVDYVIIQDMKWMVVNVDPEIACVEWGEKYHWCTLERIPDNDEL